jgi:hypothetical protein
MNSQPFFIAFLFDPAPCIMLYLKVRISTCTFQCLKKNSLCRQQEVYRLKFESIAGLNPLTHAPLFNRSFFPFIFSITFTYIIKNRNTPVIHILY